MNKAIHIWCGIAAMFVLGCASLSARQSPVIERSEKENRERGVALSSEREMEQQVHRNINDYRRRQGLEKLEFNETVASAAREHSAAMASGKTPFGHDGFDKRNQKLSKSIPVQAMAENVANGKSTVNDVVDLIHNGWLHSEGHHKNIVGDFNMTGVGVATAKDGTIHFTQIFLKTFSE